MSSYLLLESCFNAFASFFHAFMLLHMFLFGYFLVFVFFFLIEKSEKYKNSMCYVYIGTCVAWMAIETKFSKLYISCSLDEHLYAQLSK